MATMAVLTPCFRDDLALFRELHASVLRCTQDDVMHHVVVPDRDVPLFAGIVSPRLRITGTSSLLPRRYVSTYTAVNAVRRVPVIGPALPGVQAINMRRPWPPVRGWVLQQLLKLEAVSRLHVDVVVMADSDVTLIRPTSVDDFLRDGSVRFYCGREPTTPDMVRHTAWQRVSRRLLGLPPQEDTRDYISSFLAWDPALVRSIQARVEDVTGLRWVDAMARELHLSEYMVYGCFVDNLGTEADRAFVSDDPRCRSYWGLSPLDDRAAEEFIASVQPSDLAVHIQSASHTHHDVRARVLDVLQQRVAAEG